MGFVGDAIVGIKKAIPVLAARIATVLLFFLTLGMFIGFFFARMGYNWIVLVLPVAAMFVMWQKLDEGFLFLILCAILVFVAPEFFMH